jgi:hypothetical protein
MPGVFPDYPAPVVRNAVTEREMAAATRWRHTGHKHQEYVLSALAGLAQAREPVLGAVQ